MNKIALYDAQKKIRPDLFDKDAVAWANELKLVSKSQMRRMFDELKRFDRMLDAGQKWEELYPLIVMQKSKISYSCKRQKDTLGRSKIDEHKCYDSLHQLMFDGIDQIKCRDDYKWFCLFVEAMYGFFYELAPNK